MAVQISDANFQTNLGVTITVFGAFSKPLYSPKTSYSLAPQLAANDGSGAADGTTATGAPYFYDLYDIQDGVNVYQVPQDDLVDLTGIVSYVAGTDPSGGQIVADWTEPADGVQYLYRKSDNTGNLVKDPKRYRILAIRLVVIDV